MSVKRNFIIILIVFALGLVFFNACEKNIEPLNYNSLSPAEQLAIDDEIIKEYLSTHDIEALKDSSGLYYQITKEGDENYPNVNSTVEVKYKGYLTNGTVFDETEDTTAIFTINKLIYGWQIGIPLISIGGEITLFIPSYLGYGSYPVGPIPANSVLIFDIELIDIK